MPTIPEALQLAVQHQQAGRLSVAEQIYRQILQAQPNHAVAYLNLGVVLSELGEVEKAMECFSLAIKIKPDYAAAHNNLGNSLSDLSKLENAVSSYRRAIGIMPDYADAHISLAGALCGLGSYEEALVHYRRGLELNPNSAEGHCNLGVTLRDLGDLDQAVECFRAALRIKPDFAEVYNNLGVTLWEQGNRSEAFACYRSALKWKPELAFAHCSLAVAMLAEGDFLHGWEEHEWRLLSQLSLTSRPNFRCPQWDGRPLAGKSLAIWAEQGFGDAIQFVRYVEFVATEGVEVVVCCPRPLLKLLSRVRSRVGVVPEDGPIPATDFFIPLMSLPRLFGTTLNNVPSHAQYIFPDEYLIEKWRGRLQNVPGFRVGINWRGGSDSAAWKKRDLPVSHFDSLGSIPGIDLVRLQKGPLGSEEQDAMRRLRVRDFGDEIDADGGAFMDTAAIMKNLDLVISSDTSVAHLAGAVGVPVWTALHFGGDWRWLLDREDSPWYPTMRLFRQTKPGKWDDVFNRMATALKELASLKGTRRETRN